jgi:hypothetical protein
MTEAPTGAVGMYASSVSLTWREPFHALKKFNELLVNSNANTSLGELFFNSGYHMYTSFHHTQERIKNYCSWNIFGDPSMRIIPHKPCPQEIYLYEELRDNDWEIRANNRIEADNKIKSGANVHIGSDGSIKLLPGFEIEKGASVTINGNGCSQ